jgi:WD40 repeat protein
MQGPLVGHESCVWSVHFTNDGKQIVSSSRDRTVQIWDASSHTELFEPLRGHKGEVSSVASSDKTVRVWNATLGIEALPPLPDFDDIALYVDFSLDGKKIMASSRGYFYIWDASCGTCISKTKQTEFIRHERLMGVSSSGWVRNFITNYHKNVCKLPRAVTVYTITSSAASQESIAFGFESGRLLIIRVPAPTGE